MFRWFLKFFVRDPKLDAKRHGYTKINHWDPVNGWTVRWGRPHEHRAKIDWLD